jgi:hypothetical protein
MSDTVFRDSISTLLQGLTPRNPGDVPDTWVERLKADVTASMAPLGLTADPWQKGLLESRASQILVCCSRQSGKSFTAAALALNTAILEAPATVLLISRALRQSTELLRKVKELYRGLMGQGRGVGGGEGKRFRPMPLRKWQVLEERYRASEAAGAAGLDAVQESVLSMELLNGSRIISLPGKPETIVGYSAITLLVLDEASRIPDDLYRFLRPMLATSRGRLVALSTPLGKRGWFWEAHQRCDECRRLGVPMPWEQVRITADQCPRISMEFLEEELAEIGPRWYDQEYRCEFVDTVDSVFGHDVIHAALSDEVKPMF